MLIEGSQEWELAWVVSSLVVIDQRGWLGFMGEADIYKNCVRDDKTFKNVILCHYFMDSKGGRG